MSQPPRIPPGLETAGIKQVPQEAAMRRAIHEAAAGSIGALAPDRPPTWDAMERCGREALRRAGLGEPYLGFAMVAVNNAFWRPAFERVPCGRRLLLLPHCLSDRRSCEARIDAAGLHCAGCGSCDIHGLKTSAEALGYKVVVAEGTSSVILDVLEGGADAVLGVACLDSLEKSFHRVVDLGIPQVVVPLLVDGCVDTRAELDSIGDLMSARSSTPGAPVRTWIPLLRLTARLFASPALEDLLDGLPGPGSLEAGDPGATTARIALEWLREGGKRLRPFITLAAYAAARHGEEACSPSVAEDGRIPPAVRRAALAIEVLHKASLVHDDIEDDDAFRYGRRTLHRIHGIGPAVNVGDHLIGLGYALIASSARELGDAAAADILARLSRAHLELTRGQGAELLWQESPDRPLRPGDVLGIYALKTAPAFEAALYTGLRAAGAPPDAGLLRRFSTNLGSAFQIADDLADWRSDGRERSGPGPDALGRRPTILRAFAEEADGGKALRDAQAAAEGAGPASLAVHLRQAYTAGGAFLRAERLYGKLRERTFAEAEEFPSQALRDLLRFLARMVLPPAAPGAASGPS